ncbi:MAG: TlpA family protein disulfide reductase [Chloroflexi bacterium]|nr:TlpA family protein disulfide reductase [Chloroflexota bacterium]MCL5107571.1 TlpA family protein disulfide reductase [Chloroflexota bacterium]
MAVCAALVVLAGTALLAWGVLGGRGVAAAEPTALRSGRMATDFTLELYSGGTFHLAEQRGKVVLVNFWASWCPPCKEEAPVLERAWQAYQDQAVVFVGVDVWDTQTDARAFMEEYGITYPNVIDSSGEVAIEYGLTGVPETWVLGREGRLVRRWVGALNDQQIAAFLEEALR